MSLKVRLSKTNLSQLSNYLNNLAAAWFIAGIITPIFILDKFTILIFFRAILGIIMSVVFLYASFRYNKSR
jgi:hypothetical protein